MQPESTLAKPESTHVPPESIQIDVRLEAGVFRRFALRDAFIHKRRWTSPVSFMVILLGFAVAAFVMKDRDQSALIGTVLTAIAVGLPVVYFFTFLSSVNKNIKSLGLEAPRLVYSLTLSAQKNGILVHNHLRKEDDLTLEWAAVYGAIRVRGCIYFYVTPARAFLLPDGQATASPDELWAFLCAQMPGKVIRDKRRR